MFFRKKKQAQPMPPKQIRWRTPGGGYSLLADEVLKSEHTLIAGTTGCGKTSFVRAVMQALLVKESPADAKLIIIDPKRFEMSEYAELPHVLKYAQTSREALDALRQASGILEARAQYMSERHLKRCDMPDVYVIIDELNDLMMSECAASIKREMEHIITLGRALRIHIIACTQNPNKKTIPTNIVDCYTCRIGMRCLSDIKSRQIVGISGCEKLPKHGQAITIINGEINRDVLPYVAEGGIDNLISYWMSPECIA